MAVDIFFDETPSPGDASYNSARSRFAVEWFAVNAMEVTSPTVTGRLAPISEGGTANAM